MDSLFPMRDTKPAGPALGLAETASVMGKAKKSFFRKKLLARNFSHLEDREEFRILDYMPTICARPIDLHDPLRVRRSGRTIKLFLCITMYNEHADELKRSLRGVAEQLDQLEPGLLWEEMAVCIIVDGREKMNKSMLSFCEKELKLFDPDLLRYEHNGSNVTCHIFEKSVELAKHTSSREYFKPLQMILAIKERNGGKLNSHLWYFGAFARQLQPKYTFLLDVGTIPQPGAFARLFHAMEENPQVGGCCGEIAVRSPRVYNLIEASQHFEYKISHVMDKSMESVFGYISVLPGAFSAYRWQAIRGEPLNQYFYIEEHSGKELGPFLANMYLAEDRVLCFELLAKFKRNWTMTFVSGAVAETDVPDNLLELTKQRRRWLNGSFFALVFYISKFSRVLHRSRHGFFRRIGLSVQFVYNLGLLFLNWLAVGSLYLSYVIIFTMSFDALPEVGNEIMFLFTLMYTFLTILQLLCGLGSKPHDVQRIYFVSSMGYGMIMVFALAMSIWHLTSGKFSVTIVIASGGAFACYGLSSLLHGQMLTTMSVLPQYLFMLPTFVNMFTIFSFCNMHDISWGTKEGNLAHEQARSKQTKQLFPELNKEGKDVLAGLNLGGKDAGATRGASMTAMLKNGAKAAAGAGGASSKDEELAQMKAAAIMFSQAAQQAAEEKAMAEVKRKEEQLMKLEQEMAREFAGFRTRLLCLWIVSNWSYVTAVTHFDLVDFFAFGLAALIAATLLFRSVGTVIYQSERVIKWFWATYCGWCCCRACWEPKIVIDEETAQSRKVLDDADWSDESGDDRWSLDSSSEEESDDDYYRGRDGGGRPVVRDIDESGRTLPLEDGKRGRSRSRSTGTRSSGSRSRSSGSRTRSYSGSSRSRSRSRSGSRSSRSRSRSGSRSLRSDSRTPSPPPDAGGDAVVERRQMIDLGTQIKGAQATTDHILARNETGGAGPAGGSRQSSFNLDVAESKGGHSDDDVDEIVTVETTRAPGGWRQATPKN